MKAAENVGPVVILAVLAVAMLVGGVKGALGCLCGLAAGPLITRAAEEVRGDR